MYRCLLMYAWTRSYASFLFHLHHHFSNSCVYVSKHVYAFHSFSIIIHIYCHIRMYTCFDYFVMNPSTPNAPIIKRLCVPAPKSVTWCLHTCDPMFKGLHFSNLPCLRFLWMHTYHVHVKKVRFWVYLPPPICVLQNHVFIHVFSIHLNTCSGVHVYIMCGNAIRINWLHNEIYQEINEHINRFNNYNLHTSDT